MTHEDTIVASTIYEPSKTYTKKLAQRPSTHGEQHIVVDTSASAVAASHTSCMNTCGSRDTHYGYQRQNFQQRENYIWAWKL
jgi:hypothetical protein